MNPIERRDIQALQARITNYLGNGGFFNPEMMEHDKVRDLLMDCRDALSGVETPQEDELARLRRENEVLRLAHAGMQATLRLQGDIIDELTPREPDPPAPACCRELRDIQALREYVQHKPECGKRAAVEDIGYAHIHPATHGIIGDSVRGYFVGWRDCDCGLDLLLDALSRVESIEALTERVVYPEPPYRNALRREALTPREPDPPAPDVTCDHGTALDVHCCNCHSGFIFDKDHECQPPPCYHCKEGRHGECVGVPCGCACDGVAEGVEFRVEEGENHWFVTTVKGGEHICWCWTDRDAQRIADALNART